MLSRYMSKSNIEILFLLYEPSTTEKQATFQENIWIVSWWREEYDHEIPTDCPVVSGEYVLH